MINYQAFGLVGWLQLLQQELTVFGNKHMLVLQILAARPAPSEFEPPPDAPEISRDALVVTADDRKRLNGLLTYADHLCKQLQLSHTEDRLHWFEIALRPAEVAPGAVMQELRTLHQALQDDLRFKGFYYYPDAKRAVLQRLETDWAKALAPTAFPSTRPDVEAAVDCYAIGHNKAAVFSCMQVLERGLEALAAEVELTFDTQQWHNIIDEIEKKITAIRKNGIPGADKRDKDARLQLLSEDAKEFSYFKDAWRNYVSHGHAAYDEYQALSVIEHTRAFMNHLSERLSEVPR